MTARKTPTIKTLPAPATPDRLVMMAVEQGADIDRLSKLMDLQERWEAEQSRKSFIVARAAFRAECPEIPKAKQAHNAKYADLADSINIIKPALASNGLDFDWDTTQADGQVTVTCTVSHVDGHSVSTSLSAPLDTSGSKNAIQSLGSSVKYLQRYTLFSRLGLASQDEDTDGNDIELINAAASLNECESIKDLQATFKMLWESMPKHRKALAAVKDERKEVLSK